MKRPVLTYASETWAVKEDIKQKLYIWKPVGLRAVGRPEIRWVNTIKCVNKIK